jgi:hypothetical protein
MVMISYSAYGNIDFQENLWLIPLEYIVVIGVADWELYFRKKSNPEKALFESTTNKIR